LIIVGTIIFLVIVLYLSAFYSGAETVYSSVNKIRLRYYVNKNKKGSKKALYIAENFEDTITTILVGNNITNVAATSVAATLATQLFGTGIGLALSTVVMTIIILVFAEILPKTAAKENADKLSLKYAGILYLNMKVLQPVNFLSRKLSELYTNSFGEKEILPSITEEEIKLLVDISEDENVINKEERDLIHRSLELKRMTVGEVLIPVPNIIAVEVNQSNEEIKNVFLHERFARVLVYKENIDTIIGYLKEREFLSHLIENKESNVMKLLRHPLFVKEHMSIASLLPKLQKKKTQMAVVVDDSGRTLGIITLEDILEILVGEIWDEHDASATMVNYVGGSLYIIDSRFQLQEFAKMFQVRIPETNAKNIGGWIYERFDRIPEEGFDFRYKDLKLTMHEVDNYRIRKVKVEVIS
jgi:putative hemolysin